MAIGVGRIVPELQPEGPTWPYAVIGVGFALYGIVLFARGTARGREEALSLGAEPLRRDRLDVWLALGGPLLGLSVIALIAFA